MPGSFNEPADSSESEGRHIVINALVSSLGNQIGFMPDFGDNHGENSLLKKSWLGYIVVTAGVTRECGH
jgi:hypothetical protein